MRWHLQNQLYYMLYHQQLLKDKQTDVCYNIMVIPANDLNLSHP